ncbi:MAG TPA: ATP-binding protein, partial [Lamprocystis sp. (in: g-proteobacteria)]|nr:ATP-binding protein [Lamprocystis sp. (in: g-proteobacteria)]
AQRIQQMLDGMLVYSRVNRRAREPIATPADAAVDQALANLRLTLEERQAHIVRGPLPAVLADPGQLLQLFQNLIGNALKFSPGSPPRVEIAATPAGSHWQFAVRDWGIGIDSTQNERIFELFARLHPRGDYPGTGIGLAVCKKIVERHGGRIWVESQPGFGATFFFTLPGVEAALDRTEVS